MVRWNTARNTAKKIVEQLGVVQPPVPVSAIAEEHGLEIIFVDFASVDSEVSGMIDMAHKRIMVNDSDSAVRQNFTIAHELGHFFLHSAELAENPGLGIYYRRDEQNIQDEKEKEANAFAAALLMPESLISRYRSIASVDQLASLFGVSTVAMKFRLESKYF